uniref:Uncharacterized protein n=1 Tax=Pseudomonas phage HRDY3 TaxID=3236930 RepID=A0AB39CDE6_9VIRU
MVLNAYPELILSACMGARGLSNGTFSILHTDLVLEDTRSRPDIERAYLHIHDDRGPHECAQWFTQFYGSPEATAKFLSGFQGRLEFANVPMDKDHPTQKGQSAAFAIANMIEKHPGKEICVYIDLFRMFRLGCTNGAGMVVPFTVETQEPLAKMLLEPSVRFRVATMHTRLEGNPRKL